MHLWNCSMHWFAWKAGGGNWLSQAGSLNSADIHWSQGWEEARLHKASAPTGTFKGQD